MKTYLQAKKRSTSKQSPRIIVRQLKKNLHHNPQKGHGNGEFIQTNSSTNTLLSSQKSDAQQVGPVKGFIEGWCRLGAGSPTDWSCLPPHPGDR
jgi:hypothetical protein